METCKGTTKSGARCRATVGLVNGYCRLHRDQASDVASPVEETSSAPKSAAEPVAAPETTAMAEEKPGGLGWWLFIALIAILLAGLLCGRKTDK